jgi:hypothetical protein
VSTTLLRLFTIRTTEPTTTKTTTTFKPQSLEELFVHRSGGSTDPPRTPGSLVLGASAMFGFNSRYISVESLVKSMG